ncbi:MAG: sugar ABC transporter ATP-binding protein [Verrucomicrobiales bacterium]|nr:sugar ABC transporter ATP-binding protein [Verrucomicrobiales bacterium]
MVRPATISDTPVVPLLRLAGVRKSFGGVQALKGVDFDLRAGEIHALLGENGAGKSTLIKVLGGIHQPDAGAIEIDGRPVRIDGVAAADRMGIRLIHQELSLAPNLSIAENIYLGREPARLGFVQRRRMMTDAAAVVRGLGLSEIAEVGAGVAGLSVARQQLVEIARALSCRARMLVLDEPTSSLSEAEARMLFATLGRLRAQGTAIIYISHRLEEISRLADRITVLRDGESVGTQRAADLDRRRLVRWMVGREIDDHFPRTKAGSGEVVLAARGLRNRRVHDVTFELRAGEVLGIAGLVGSGRSELARAIFGLDPLEAGELRMGGRAVRIRSPRDALRAGLVLVPEDRKLQGLIVTQSVAFNLALPWVRDWIRGCRPDWSRRQAIVERAVQRFGIKLADPEQPVDSLSGGNQQKVLVGRWMEHPPRVLMLDEPTRGVDVGAREEIFRFITELVASGIAVLLISSDLDEVLHLSHRIAVYRDGRIVTVGPAGEFTAERVMEQLTGACLEQRL